MVNVTRAEEPFDQVMGKQSTTTPRTLYLPDLEQASDIGVKLLSMTVASWKALGLRVLQASDA